MSTPTSTAPRVRRLAGVALTSNTISGNRRWYAEPVVRAAVEAAAPRVRAGKMLMMSSHSAHAEDDALRCVGRVVDLYCDDAGTVHYTAELVNTRAADDVYELCSGDRSHLAVSIRGAWRGSMVRETGPDGLPVEHAPELELLGLDTCLEPGVALATAQALERARDPHLVLETLDAAPTVLPDAPTVQGRYSCEVAAALRERALVADFDARADAVRAQREATNAARWGR